MYQIIFEYLLRLTLGVMVQCLNRLPSFSLTGDTSSGLRISVNIIVAPGRKLPTTFTVDREYIND